MLEIVGYFRTVRELNLRKNPLFSNRNGDETCSDLARKHVPRRSNLHAAITSILQSPLHYVFYASTSEDASRSPPESNRTSLIRYRLIGSPMANFLRSRSLNSFRRSGTKHLGKKSARNGALSLEFAIFSRVIQCIALSRRSGHARYFHL